MANRTTPPVGHETQDISPRLVAWSAIVLAVSTLMVGLAVVGFYRLLSQEHPSPELSSRIELQPRMLAPAPRLQRDPTADYEKFAAEEKARLEHYDWIDKNAGIVRIPIERAMDLIAERGLPTRGPGTQNASGITSIQMQERKAAETK